MFCRGMDEIIRGLYKTMINENNPGKKISQKTEQEILYALREERTIKSKGGGELRDLVLFVSSGAEENGFVEGFRYAVRLYNECLNNRD